MTRTITRKTLLAGASVAAAAGAGLAAAPAQAATAASSGPVVTESLSAPGATPDAQGDLTAALGATGRLAVTVRYEVSPAPGVSPSGTPGPSGSLECGVPGDTPITLSQMGQFGFGGAATCTYTKPGVYTVTLTATDNLTPAQTASVSRHVTVTPIQAVPLDRYDGASRYGTGVALSQAAFPAAGSAGAVVLARGDVFADALAGIPLAKAKNGPLLLTPGGPAATAPDPAVEAELLRVLPHDKNHTVYILGGTGAIPQPVQDRIASLGYTVVRLAGASRFDTALAIAQDPRALNNPAHVVVARGDDYADALAAGPFAANVFQDSHGTPAAIVLSDGPAAAASIDPATAAYVRARAAAPADRGTAEPASLKADVVTVGGGAERAVRDLGAGAFQPLTGTDRFDTARRVAMTGWQVPGDAVVVHPYFKVAQIGLATGLAFPDALTGGAFMALRNGPLLLTGAGDLEPAARDTIRQDSVEDGLKDLSVFGGPKVLSDEVVKIDVAAAIQPAPIAYTDHHVVF